MPDYLLGISIGYQGQVLLVIPIPDVSDVGYPNLLRLRWNKFCNQVLVFMETVM